MNDDAVLSDAERALIGTAIALTAGGDVRNTCGAVLDAVTTLFSARSCWVLLLDPATNCLVTVDFRGPGAEIYADVQLPADQGIVGVAFSERRAVFVPDVQSEQRWFDPARVHRAGLRAVLTTPLIYDEAPVGVLGLDSPRFTAACPPGEADLERLRGIAAHAAVAIRNAQTRESIEQDRRRLRRLLQERRTLRHEVGHLRDAVRQAHAYDAVIGESALWKSVLEQVELVATADSTVLLVGETGTGKELIARAIHQQSRRRGHAFVAVNCAALPESLVESELFGHERGAFTGAFDRKPGKFELADRGTLFLDEVGDLPAPVQAKLLRTLQEREVLRLGATKPVLVNVRLIAATNRDLDDALRSGEFRQDLFYRLSVFPIQLPPLRQRPTDVAILARHFVLRFAERQGRDVPRLTAAALDALRGYPWPGNVRELQNVIERAMILAVNGDIGPELLALSPARAAHAASPAPAGPSAAAAADRAPPVVSFRESERRAILRALETTGWRISGGGGAAELLGLKPTTLHAKMKRLGIRRPSAATAPDES